MRASVTSADVGLSLDHCRPLVYRAETSLLGSIHSSFVKKREQSSSAMKTELKRKGISKTSFHKDGITAGTKSAAEMEHIIDATPVVSALLQPGTKSIFKSYFCVAGGERQRPKFVVQE